MKLSQIILNKGRLNEGIEDEHGEVIEQFEQNKDVMSKADVDHFEKLMKTFAAGYEDDDDNQMEGALDDMIEVLKKYKINV